MTRPLHLGGAARYKSESQRPDLWPDYSWNPVMGVTGSMLLDYSGNRLNASLVGPSWAKGALSFDGSDDWVDVSQTAQVIPATGEFSVSTLLNTDLYDSSVSHTAFSTENATTTAELIFYANYGATNITRLYIRNRGGEILAGPSIRLTGWRNVAITYDGTANYCLYIDGVLLATANNADNDPIAPAYTIGGAPKVVEGRRFFYKGLIGTNSIYRKNLTQSQIVALHADPLLPFRRKTMISLYVPSGAPAGLAHNIFGSPVFGKLVG